MVDPKSLFSLPASISPSSSSLSSSPLFTPSPISPSKSSSLFPGRNLRDEACMAVYVPTCHVLTILRFIATLDVPAPPQTPLLGTSESESSIHEIPPLPGTSPKEEEEDFPNVSSQSDQEGQVNSEKNAE